MIEIRLATLNDIMVIRRLAQEIWWPTYRSVISDEQISFMLEKMYSEKALEAQFNDHHIFLLLLSGNQPKGFACYAETEIEKIYKLHKIYIHPDQQGKGSGKQLISKVEELVKAAGANSLFLNVNRGNKAQFFYQKLGYEIVEEIDIPYYHFVLNDFVMKKSLY